MTRRTTIVGQAPGANNGRERPFEGPCARRLAELIGTTEAELRRRTRLVNILPYFPGDAGRYRGKGDKFPIDVARAKAWRMPLRGTTLLAGHNVARAYGICRATYFRWLYVVDFFGTRETIGVAVIPHPSGVNRWWGDPSNVRRTSAFLRDVIL